MERPQSSELLSTCAGLRGSLTARALSCSACKVAISVNCGIVSEYNRRGQGGDANAPCVLVSDTVGRTRLQEERANEKRTGK